MFTLIVVGFVSLFVVTSNGQCELASSCVGSTVFISTTDNIQCYGFKSCENAFLLTGGEVECDGSYSCYQSNVIKADNGVDCLGLSSCSSCPDITTGGGIVCRGEQACRDSTIVETSTSGIVCDGLRGCAGATITRNGGFSNSIRGALAAEGATFNEQTTTGLHSFTFGGYKSAIGAQIICEGTCSIFCYGSACDDLTLTCDTSDPTCTFNVNCDQASQSTLCPNALSLPSSKQIPDITSMEFSTDDNSINLCNGVACDDFEECQSSGGTVFNTNPICCRGSESCSLFDIISGNTDGFSDISIRFDGDKSGEDILSILATNGGDIYFAGSDATSESGPNRLSTIEGNGNNNVIVSGYNALFQGQTIENINDLYCLSPFACFDLIGNDINGNVYAFGWRSLELESVLTNVGGSIYCDGATACNSLTVTNVGGDIIGRGGSILQSLTATDVDGCIVGYGNQAINSASLMNVAGDILAAGYRALYQSVLNNVASVVCDGEECLAGSTITGISKLTATGTNSLGNILIISEDGYGSNEFVLTVTGTNTDPYEVICSENDKCEINCLSEDACGTMSLVCNGICTLNCDSSFNCPDVDTPTKEPTEEPLSNLP